MDHPTACEIFQNSAGSREIRFVTPIISVMLAAACVQEGRQNLSKRVTFGNDAQNYAKNNGLLDILQGRYEFPKRTGNQGITYSKLTRLSTYSEVEACNQVTNDLIYEHLGALSEDIASKVCGVVGELHDNVASHANGTGFSCGQVYTSGGGRRLIFSIADTGCGMSANVRRVCESIQSDDEAIRWCLQRGHTTAGFQHEWAQRLPEDSFFNPYPTTVETTSNENHHVGEGLWRLCELVKLLEGKIWISSGAGSFFWQHGKEMTSSNRINWNGVAIEFEIDVGPVIGKNLNSQARLEELAVRMGL